MKATIIFTAFVCVLGGDVSAFPLSLPRRVAQKSELLPGGLVNSTDKGRRPNIVESFPVPVYDKKASDNPNIHAPYLALNISAPRNEVKPGPKIQDVFPVPVYDKRPTFNSNLRPPYLVAPNPHPTNISAYMQPNITWVFPADILKPLLEKSRAARPPHRHGITDELLRGTILKIGKTTTSTSSSSLSPRALQTLITSTQSTINSTLALIDQHLSRRDTSVTPEVEILARQIIEILEINEDLKTMAKAMPGLTTQQARALEAGLRLIGDLTANLTAEANDSWNKLGTEAHIKVHKEVDMLKDEEVQARAAENGGIGRRGATQGW